MHNWHLEIWLHGWKREQARHFNADRIEFCSDGIIVVINDELFEYFDLEKVKGYKLTHNALAFKEE